MTIIYVTEHNTKCYAVTYENKGWIKVQKIQDVVDDDNNIINEVNLLEIFIGKSIDCKLTRF